MAVIWYGEIAHGSRGGTQNSLRPYMLSQSGDGYVQSLSSFNQINAEEFNQTAYPPGDHTVISYLQLHLRDIDQVEYQKRVEGFYYGLFTVTRKRLSEIVLPSRSFIDCVGRL